jgi:hypothetical protein
METLPEDGDTFTSLPLLGEEKVAGEEKVVAV